MNFPRNSKIVRRAARHDHWCRLRRCPDATPYYKGRTVTIVIASSAGGGYDAYARLLGRYLGKHLPGEPTVVVSNMPGAGSEVTAAYVARVAPKDGTYIAAPHGDQPLDPILGDATSLKYDPTHINYLGTAVSDEFLCVVRRDAPATTFDDMFRTQVIMGGTAENDEAGYLPIMLNNVFGTKFKVVVGYAGSRETVTAVENGEIHGTCGSLRRAYPNIRTCSTRMARSRLRFRGMTRASLR